MGVYIDMEMPNHCGECGIEWCERWKRLIVAGMPSAKARPEDCPLVPIPPHGRLIDADALMDLIKSHDYPLRAYFNSTDNGMFTIGIQQAVDETPTIIPAEEGE